MTPVEPAPARRQWTLTETGEVRQANRGEWYWVEGVPGCRPARALQGTLMAVRILELVEVR